MDVEGKKQVLTPVVHDTLPDLSILKRLSKSNVMNTRNFFNIFY